MITINSAPQNITYTRTSTAPVQRERANEAVVGSIGTASGNTPRPDGSPSNSSASTKFESASVRQVNAVPQNDQTSTRNNRPVIDDNEIRQAQLVGFNRRDFDALQTFITVQNQDDLSSIVDTYA